MKIVEKYKCDVCGTEYKDRKDATECENGHKKAKKKGISLLKESNVKLFGNQCMTSTGD